MAKSILTAYNFNQNEIQNPRLQQLASDPGSPVEGQFWYNTTANVAKYQDDGGVEIFASQAWVTSQIGASGGGDMLAATYDPTAVAGDAFAMDNMVEGTTTKIMTAAERTKLSNIETAADVTDATNVAAAGAVMDGDFSTNGLMARTGAGTYAVVTDNSSNWNTAFGWGNHASAGYAASSHTHTASAITDFDTAVDTRVVAYWDSIADTDVSIDTIRELMDLVLSNESGLANIIGRHNADVGDGASTSIAVTHSLNSLDVSVEVYRKSDGATVECDVVRTNVNVVTLGFATAPTSAQYRVVIKK